METNFFKTFNTFGICMCHMRELSKSDVIIHEGSSDSQLFRVLREHLLPKLNKSSLISKNNPNFNPKSVFIGEDLINALGSSCGEFLWSQSSGLESLH